MFADVGGRARDGGRRQEAAGGRVDEKSLKVCRCCFFINAHSSRNVCIDFEEDVEDIVSVAVIV